MTGEHGPQPPAADDAAERAVVAELAAIVHVHALLGVAERVADGHSAGPDGHCGGCQSYGWVRAWPCRHVAVGERVAELRGGRR